MYVHICASSSTVRDSGGHSSYGSLASLSVPSKSSAGSKEKTACLSTMWT